MLVSAVIAVFSAISPVLSYTWPNHPMDELEHLLVDTGGPDDGGIKAVWIVMLEKRHCAEICACCLRTVDTKRCVYLQKISWVFEGSWDVKYMLAIFQAITPCTNYVMGTQILGRMTAAQCTFNSRCNR
jgi:hypothetical protein